GLGFAHRVAERETRARHAAENVIGGSVDDGGNALDAVGLQVGAEGADQGNAAPYGRLEVDVDISLRGQVEQLRSVLGHHNLVCGHDMLAGANRPLQICVHRLIAPSHLDQDLDAGVVDQLICVGGQQLGADIDLSRLLDVP